MTDDQYYKNSAEAKCPRCGDMFYNPKTTILDAKQHASEWEEISKRLEKELDALKAKNDQLISFIKEAKNHCGWVTAQDKLNLAHNCAYTALDVLNKALAK